MKGDVHAGGELMVCKRGAIPQQKLSIRDKNFILMPLTSLFELLICILIIAGTKPLTVTELIIDQFKDMVGKVTDEDFIEKQPRKRKICPSVPACIVRGFKVPYFI